MNNNLESIIKYLDLAETLGVEEIKLSGFELRVLNEHLRTLSKQNKQLALFVNYLNKDIVNLSKEIGSIEL